MAIRTGVQAYIKQIRAMVSDLDFEFDAVIDQTLTLTDPGAEIIYAVEGAITITLPAASAVTDTSTITFVKTDAGTTTMIQRAGSDTIDGADTAFTLTEQYQVKRVTSDETDDWTTALLARSLQVTDALIQGILDRCSVVTHRLWLNQSSDGTVFWRLSHWEQDSTVTALMDADGEAVTPDTSDYERGVWKFDTEQTGPYAVAGRIFDLRRAASEVLEQMAAQVMRDYSFSGDGGSFQRNQVHGQILTQAQKYLAQQRPYAVPVWED